MNPSEWLQNRLQITSESVVWALEQVPIERQFLEPPKPSYFGTWSAARIVFHLYFSEQLVALVNMQQWQGAPKPTLEPFKEESAVWTEGCTKDELVTKFQQGRDKQVALIKSFTAWDETQDTFWGDVNMYWVVSKTLQHAYSHMSRILKIALFWDMRSTK